MKLNKLTIITLFYFLPFILSKGQDSLIVRLENLICKIDNAYMAKNGLVDITSKTREGFNDLIFSVVDTQLVDNYWIITAKGYHQGTVVGFIIKLKNGLKPGLVDGRMDNTSWAWRKAEMSGIGKESDNFVKVFSGLWGIKTDKPFTSKPLQFTCFSLNTQPAYLDKGYFKFKFYFDDSNNSGIYSEIFLNFNLPEGYIEMPEKDPQYIGDFIKAITR